MFVVRSPDVEMHLEKELYEGILKKCAAVFVNVTWLCVLM